MPVRREELGRRLRDAREACSLTQEQVVDLLAEHGVRMSRPTLVQTEAGKRAVTSVELERLAYLYGRDMRHFLADEAPPGDPVLALFRNQPDLPQDGMQVALRQCVKLGREVANLERRLGIDRDVQAITTYGMAPPRRKWDAIQQGERLARDERRRLGLGKTPIPNVADLLDAQGILAAMEKMPDDVSGLTLVDPEIGVLIVVNEDHALARRRFSYAHEYCHVLADRERKGIVSRSSERDELTEVRANAFAAAFLMPDYGMREFVSSLGKGRASRMGSTVFDESGTVEAHARSDPGSQDLQFYDVVQIAHYFGASRTAVIYRLRNLRMISQSQMEALLELDADPEGRGEAVAEMLGMVGPQSEQQRDDRARSEFKSRFMGLALEAFRRRTITRAKLVELARQVRVDSENLEQVLEFLGLEEDGGAGILIPESIE